MITKKIKNKKQISQNLRNKLQNRRYLTLLKFFFKRIKQLLIEKKKKDKISFSDKIKILTIGQRLESTLDKAVKKKIIHKNTSSRKKSSLQALLAKELS